MKKSLLITLCIGLLWNLSISAQENLSPYIKVGTSSATILEVESLVKTALGTKYFDIIGSYHPEGSPNLSVIVYTRKDLQNAVLFVEDRGGLAAALKVGLVKKEGEIIISYLNPDYLFNAYLMGEYPKVQSKLNKTSTDIKEAMKSLGNEFTEFGGSLSTDELQEYHYMMMMPYFKDPVKLNTFSSFEQGLKTIRKNLAAKKGNTLKVYELVFADREVAVFGIGVLDAEEGEGAFLPIVGEAHVAAMPYEIILEGNTVTMLHGKYRFALHWPELTMGTFMKISSMPGNIEKMLEAVTQE
jgi:hypothetical protein